MPRHSSEIVHIGSFVSFDDISSSFRQQINYYSARSGKFPNAFINSFRLGAQDKPLSKKTTVATFG